MNNEKKLDLYKEASKYCLDISKLIFGGVILGSIMRLDINKLGLFISGFIVVLVLVFVGFLLRSLSNPAKK